MTNHRRYRLNPDAIHAIKELQKQLRANSLHDSGFDEALSFDPESDALQSGAEAKIREMMGDVADRARLAPDLAYAIRKTGLLVTDRNKHLLDDDQKAVWNDAIAEYERLIRQVQ
jgi:hypothetical protein